MARRDVDLEACPGATLDDLDAALVELYREELARRRPGSPLIRLPLESLLLKIGAALAVG